MTSLIKLFVISWIIIFAIYGVVSLSHRNVHSEYENTSKILKKAYKKSYKSVEKTIAPYVKKTPWNKK